MARPLKILFITITAILILFMIIVVLTIIMFPRQRIIELIENQGTAALGMPVTVGDAGISFRGAPTLKLVNITAGPIQGQTTPLAQIPSVRIQVNIFRLLRGQIEILGVEVNQPKITMIIPAQPTAAASSSQGPAGPTQIPLPLSIKNVSVRGGTVTIRMENPERILTLENVDEQLALTLDNATLDAKGTITVADISFVPQAPGKPISGIKATFSHEINGNLGTGNFTLQKGNLKLNDLTMSLTGSLNNWSAGTFALTAEKTDASRYLALIPVSLFPDRDKLNVEGPVSFSVQGAYDTAMPQQPVQFIGNIHFDDIKAVYQGYPKPIESITGSIAFTDQDVSFDKLLVSTGESTLNLTGTIISYAKAPVLNLHLAGNVLAQDFTSALPVLAKNKISGRANIDLKVAGQGYKPDGLAPSGVVAFNMFSFEIPKTLRHSAELNGKLTFTPDTVTLDNFRIVSGRSDFQFLGTVAGYLRLLEPSGGTAVFNGSLNSNLVDVVDLLPIDLTQPLVVPRPWELGQAIEQVPLPPNLEATLKVTFGKVVFTPLTADSMKGTLAYSNGVLDFSDLALKAYQGTLTGATRLDFSNPKLPTYSLSFKLTNLDSGSLIAALFNTRNFIHSNLSGTLNLGGAGLDSLSMMQNMTGDGTLVFAKGQVDNWPPLRQLGQYLKFLNFDTVSFDTIQNSFRIEKAKVITPDIRLHTSSFDLLANGETGFDTSINYTLSIALNRTLSQQAVKSLLSVNVPASVPPLTLDINAGGTLESPSFKLDTVKLEQSIGGQVKEDLKTKAQDLLQQTVKDSSLQEQGKKLLDGLFR